MITAEEYEDLRTEIEAEYQEAILRARQQRDEALKAIAIVRRLTGPVRDGRPPKPRDKNGKDCAGCKTWKPYSEFHLNPSSSDGRNVYCKDCRKKKNPPKPPAGAQTNGGTKRLCAKGEDCLGYQEPGGSPNLVPVGGGLLCGACKERAGLA